MKKQAKAGSDLITILIPTRERADTLQHCLRTCIRQKDERLRILVSDNASQDDTKTVVQEFAAGDSRVEYINPGHRLGMSEHWEYALGHISEGFVSVLGDDDALFPDALFNIREILNAWPEIDAISWPYSFYGYPSLTTAARNQLGLEFGERTEIRNSREWLRKLAAFDVSYFELPMVYYGLVRNTVLDNIRARSGRLICSFVPDVYLALAVACSTQAYYRFSKSLTLCGTSHHSNGASMAIGEDSSIVKDFFGETQLRTHPLVPYFPSIPAFVLESLFCAKDAGLLPADLRIDLRTGITRIFVELHAAGHSQPVLDEYLKRLGRLARGLEQGDHFDQLSACDSRAREALAKKLAVREGHPKHHILVNLTDTPVRDVVAAVDLAAVICGNESLQRVWQRMSNETRQVHVAFENQIIQLRELEALARRQQEELETRHVEFLDQIAAVGQELARVQAESTSRFYQIAELTDAVKAGEKDRSKRLAQVHELDFLVRSQQKELEMRQAEFDNRLALLAQELERARSEPASQLY